MNAAMRTPAVFIGHGSPMNTLEHNRYTDAWRAFGTCIERPRAVLVVSAHWYTNATAVTAMAQPRTIHDFYGFPEELFAVEYPAPGSVEVAELVEETVKPRWVGLDRDSWGLDHGAWSVARPRLPRRRRPRRAAVDQRAATARVPPRHRRPPGAAAATRASSSSAAATSCTTCGASTGPAPTSGFDWTRRFDDAAIALMRDRPGDILELVEHPDFDLAVPTPDHFIPLLYIAGMAAASGDTPEVLVDGYAYGSLSMTCFTLGADCPQSGGDDSTGTLAGPIAGTAPPEQANI